MTARYNDEGITARARALRRALGCAPARSGSAIEYGEKAGFVQLT